MKIAMLLMPVVSGNAANNSMPLRSTIMPATLPPKRFNTHTWHFRGNREEEVTPRPPLCFRLFANIFND